MNALITQGSTGTHSLERAFGDSLYRPNGWNHHLRHPQGIPPEVSKVVYLFCNPYDYVLALFRINTRSPGWIQEHTKNVSGSWCDWTHYFELCPADDMLTFLKMDFEPLRYREHAENYLHGRHDFELLFVRYEQLAIGIEPICEFWGVENPGWEWKARKSNWETESGEVKKWLHHKYWEDYDWYRNLPLVQRVPNDSECHV